MSDPAYQTALDFTDAPETEHLDTKALETWLWDAACAIRGGTDAPKFKDFILPLVFYKRLSDVFDDEFAAQVEAFGSVEAAQVQIRRMTTKWASISSRGRLTLNSDLLELPRGLGEYVVVHELVHLLVPNHGLVFKLFLDAYMPDWRGREVALNSAT